MDIDEFYDADERRRQSAEYELGTEWTDAHGVRYELNWIEDTGELYVMREPPPHEWEDPFGGIHVDLKDDAPADGMTVAVVGHIGTHDELERVLDGWPAAMARPDGAAWIADRLRQAGVAVRSENAPE
jgi:hypothetical protein